MNNTLTAKEWLRKGFAPVKNLIADEDGQTEPIKYTKEYLMETFKKVFQNRNQEPPENRTVDLLLEWKHFEWEENGERFSCWKLMAGNLFTIATTGDEGKEEFDKLMKEQFREIPKIDK